MSNFTTPGVYVKEISTLPPSVAQVATAIPAFIGYTKLQPSEERMITKDFTVTVRPSSGNDNQTISLGLDPLPIEGTSTDDLSITSSNPTDFDPTNAVVSDDITTITVSNANRPSTEVTITMTYPAQVPVIDPIRITSMKEYEHIFGGAHGASFRVSMEIDPDSNVQSIKKITKQAQSDDFLLYYSMHLYFNNGGGSCYVISVGDYETSLKEASHFTAGLDALSKVDEPTLILFPEAKKLSSADYFTVCSTALQQCSTLQDRFTLMDVDDSDTDGASFRNGIGPNSSLKYGAAYLPYLTTSLSYEYEESAISVQDITVYNKGSLKIPSSTAPNGIQVIYHGPESDTPGVRISSASGASFSNTSHSLVIPAVTGANTISAIIAAFDTQNAAVQGNFELLGFGDLTQTMSTFPVQSLGYPARITGAMDSALVKEDQTALYNKIKAELAKIRIVLPPSPAVAGVYVRVDANRGVWKAPANVSVVSIIGPTRQITHEQNGMLNVDPTSGKSINVIRNFVGKGNLIWGARTLAGNDNEWRYINVRRLFITIEESVQKACAFAVFEPNDATTWLKVKAMIDNYLYGLWQQGALAGPKPEAAYYVHVGLGKTMTTEDILNGIMNVEIGIAAVRPAEFIILKFSQKLQEA